MRGVTEEMVRAGGTAFATLDSSRVPDIVTTIYEAMKAADPEIKDLKIRLFDRTFQAPPSQADVDRVARALFDGVEVRSLRSVRNGPSNFDDFADRYRALARDAIEEMAAIATEARRAETLKDGSVHEGAGLKGIAQTQSSTPDNKDKPNG